MKTLAIALVTLSLIAPTADVFAQRAAAPGGPNDYGMDCAVDHISPGRRADAEQVKQAKEALVHRINECERPKVNLYFGDIEFRMLVAKNKKLKKYLASQGVQPEDVAGIQVRLGKLIIYAKIG